MFRPRYLDGRKNRIPSGARWKKKIYRFPDCPIFTGFGQFVKTKQTAIVFWGLSTNVGALSRAALRTISVSQKPMVTVQSIPQYQEETENALRCKFAPDKCTMSQKAVSRRIGPIGMGKGQETHFLSTLFSGLRV